MKQCLTPRWASDTGWDCLVPVFTLKIMIIGLHSTVGKWTRWCQVQWNILPAFNSLGLLECISTNQGFPIPWSAGKAPTGFYSAKTWDLPLSHNSIPSLLFQYRILIPQYLLNTQKSCGVYVLITQWFVWLVCSLEAQSRLILATQLCLERVKGGALKKGKPVQFVQLLKQVNNGILAMAWSCCLPPFRLSHHQNKPVMSQFLPESLLGQPGTLWRQQRDRYEELWSATMTQILALLLMKWRWLLSARIFHHH